jgi:hypothetical protein
MDDPLLAAAVIGFIMGVFCSGFVLCVAGVLSFRHLSAIGHPRGETRQDPSPIVIKGEVTHTS